MSRCQVHVSLIRVPTGAVRHENMRRHVSAFGVSDTCSKYLVIKTILKYSYYKQVEVLVNHPVSITKCGSKTVKKKWQSN
jgi:hypothetical protein